jgi:hypothetical protein
MPEDGSEPLLDQHSSDIAEQNEYKMRQGPKVSSSTPVFSLLTREECKDREETYV